MAKMMTTELAFELIDSGKLRLQDVHGAPRDLAPMAFSWSTIPSPRNGAGQRLATCFTASSSCPATTPVALADRVAGSEVGYVAQMNAHAQRLGLNNSRFGNTGWPDEGRTYATARDLATLARSSIERHPKLYKAPSSRRRPADHPGQPQPAARKIQGADGLKTGHTEEAGYGFTAPPRTAAAQ